ncbi:hypothetical protein AB0C96_08545 [Streptomyces sp. NPDC048506]|uniref:hypothetical protein n=1 Tax=Streptomyces sp. NPDC048506 TaxID=3155028 RepID=UPI0034239A75
MPVDIFAALGALVRAEASRTTPKPRTPATDQPATQAPSSPQPPPPPVAPDPAAGTAPDHPARRPRRAVLRKLTALVGAVRKGRGKAANDRRAPGS